MRVGYRPYQASSILPITAVVGQAGKLRRPLPGCSVAFMDEVSLLWMTFRRVGIFAGMVRPNERV
jgi:hypothetical protein